LITTASVEESTKIIEGEVGKREIEPNMTGRASSGYTIKEWTPDVIQSDRKRVGVVVVVQRAEEER